MENKNKIALVTGAGRGLGKNMALRIAEKGIDVIITYKSSEQQAQEVAAEIRQAGRKAAVLQLDVADVKSFDRFFGELKTILAKEFGAERFDYLINNGGISGNTPIGKVPEELFDNLMNVHFKGVYFLTQQALDHINDGGGIINVSTGLTRFGYIGSSAYASMKGAVEVFTKYLAKELGPRGIKANVIAPGAIATDFSGGVLRDNPEVNKHVSSVTALGRAGQAEDIGGVVAFLCTEDARWVTGQRIEASGGMYL
ncbi:SDR family oxidoreductase [Chitinophaga agrisoli]|uniref:SDR family oxidoreductase n=1 Tax=Chitinophaga agrisoli TaxID=2607653 RepID=A0A5B2VPX7_9BACT|nr:SDR family oxidoreductase [Chitinophaga agrisoli]KAA2240352.1 SDR family oxidoreductase [Chitinophaga agrisoli]